MDNRIAKKLTAVVLTAALIMSACVFTTEAASAAGSSAPRIEKIKYKGDGKVEVDFYGKVRYKKTKITVKDTSGKKYKASIRDKDNDDLDFRIKNFKKGKTYKFTIKGIKKSRSGSYTSIKGKVKIPAASKAKVKVKDIDYDHEDQELSIDFKTKVKWKNTKVTVTDSAGNSYKTYILKRDSDDIELHVSGLAYGNKYSYSISGIKARDASSYTTIKGTFWATDN